MSKLILGVDGGSTKSHLVLFDVDGNCIATEAFGPLNHEVLKGSFDEFNLTLCEKVESALKSVNANCEDVSFAVLGLAGADTTSQHKRLSDIVRSTGINSSLVCSDALLGVLSDCPDNIGICAINGSGFKIAAADKSGASIHTCGVGPLTDDFGGGTWYGQRCISMVYNELYKLGKPTIMREMLYNLTGVKRKEDFLDIVADKYVDGDINLVALNSIPFEAAAAGDDVALGLLDESAEQYAGAIARLAIDMDFPKEDTLHVALAGSVFVKQKVKLLQDLIQKRITDALGARAVNYITANAPPVAGAVIGAMQKSGITPDVAKIKAELKKLKF